MEQKKKTAGCMLEGYWTVLYALEVPPELKPLFERFRVKARNTSEPEWPVKGADLYYTYRDRYYHVGPEHFGCSGEIFEVLSDELIDALYEAGARDMFYAGMLD